jgi:hypothetical protein
MSEYNGYTNYETWCVSLWIDNDQGSHQYWNERAREEWEEAGEDSRDARSALASALEDYHAEDKPGTAGVYSDLLTRALGVVDWYEIADNILAALELGGYEARQCAP